jgi:hypothetical protein
MTETELLKAQVKELERLVSLKDQTIAHLQAQPRYSYPYYYNGYQYQQASGAGQNTQQFANTQGGSQSNVTLVGSSG